MFEPIYIRADELHKGDVVSTGTRLADLTARAGAAEAKVAAVEALADDFDGYGHGPYCTHMEEQLPCSACELLARLRTALAEPGMGGVR